MVSLEKQKPVSSTQEAAPQTPETAVDTLNQLSNEKRVKAVTDALQDTVVYSTKEQDKAVLEEWDQRNATDSAEALRRSIATDRDDLYFLPDSPNLLPNTQTAIPNELRSYLQAGDTLIAGNQVQQAENRTTYEAAQTVLQKDDKKRKLKNVFSLGIGAKRRNQRHSARVQQVESYHSSVAQQLAQHEQGIRNDQLEGVAQHRTALEAKVRSTDLMANARESAANLSDKTFEEDFDEVEARLIDSIDNSRKDGTLKQEEVVNQLQASPEFTNATPDEQQELLRRCESLVQEATQAEVDLAKATDGMKLKKLVMNRMSSKSPAGGKLDMGKFNAAANWHSAGGWEENWQPERTDALANELVKFGLDQAITVADLDPDMIIKLAANELKQSQETQQNI
ncbi:MAG: hypothetical protein WBP12_00735 [Candidatus Saccharimonas sp.]